MKFLRVISTLLAAGLVLSSCAASRYARGVDEADVRALNDVYAGSVKLVPHPSGERYLKERRMTVYLPPSYYDEPERRYPVMYLLHGARGNEVTWIERGDALRTLDSLVAAKAAREFILVLPNVNNYYSDRDYRGGRALPAVRAFFTVDGEAEVNFMQDVVATVDREFRTDARKEARAIAGMSSGGLQTLYLAANYPDSFDYVGLFSAYSHDTLWGELHPEFYGRIGRKLKKQFADPPAYYGLMIGDTDFFYPLNLIMDSYMSRKGYEHEFIVRPGGHEWYNWRAFLVHFYGKVFSE